MMDGQVRALRRALDAGGYRQTILMSYSTKFASAERGWGVLRDVVRESAQAWFAPARTC
ncbi:MAG: porphobilinogen synthase [Lentisphaerae bacterium]|nr:porphobilinogen synthase [Lentisphaerota bacterium]